MSSPSPLAGLDVSLPSPPASSNSAPPADRIHPSKLRPSCARFFRRPVRNPQASLLVVNKTVAPKPVPAANTLVFGQTFTDHMLVVPWTAAAGWGTPELKAYGPLSLDPACTVLHYSPTLFEGMKAYKDKNGNARLFRPDMVSTNAREGVGARRAQG